jgi:hypothetical protein
MLEKRMRQGFLSNSHARTWGDSGRCLIAACNAKAPLMHAQHQVAVQAVGGGQQTPRAQARLAPALRRRGLLSGDRNPAVHDHPGYLSRRGHLARRGQHAAPSAQAARDGNERKTLL